jgi:hypothetical protein
MQPRAGKQTAYCAWAEKLVIEIAIAAPTAKIVIGANEAHIGLLPIFSLRWLLRRCPSSVKADHDPQLSWEDPDDVRTNAVYFAKQLRSSSTGNFCMSQFAIRVTAAIGHPTHRGDFRVAPSPC